MHMRKLFLGLTIALAATACADGGGSNSPPPALKVVSPVRGTMQSGLADVEVRGSVLPAADIGDGPGLPVQSVEVNGVPATVDVDGQFTALVPIGAGATMLHTVALDTDGNEASDTRTIHAGNLVPMSTIVRDGITAAISDDAFAKIGEVAGTLIAQQDLGAMVRGMNPVVDSGDGPDCLFAQAFIQDLNLSSADIRLIPYAGGIRLEADIYNLDVPLDTDYAVACLDGSTAVQITADRVSIAGDLDITVTGGALDVVLMNPTVDLDNLNIDASGIPGTIIDMLSLDSAIQWIIPYAVDMFVGPMINDAIGGLAMTGPLSLDVAGKHLELTVTPAAIDFTADGGKLRLDSRFLVGGSEAAPGFIMTPNGLPSMDAGDGFQLALADDAVNQLMTGFWATGAMNMEIPHHAGQFDALRIEARMPPLMMAANADNNLEMVIGDMMVTLVAQGVEEAKLAFNVKIAMKLDGEGNYIRLGLEEPEIVIDTTDEIPNTTNLSDDDLETIHQAVIASMMDQMLPLIGTIPIPTLAGVQLVDVDVNGQNGYVTVTGAIEN
jgi:hypothetical protein